MRHLTVFIAEMAIICLSALTSNAQITSDMSDYTMPNINPYLVPPGPEAASFLRYGEYQMNHAIGLPDITIPIYIRNLYSNFKRFYFGTLNHK